MSMDNRDLQSLDRDVQGFDQPKQRGWWSRNWLWFIPTMLLATVVVCCGCLGGIVFWAFNKVYDLEMFQTSMAKIQADDTLRRELGEPINIVRWPPPAFNITETNGKGEGDIRWEVEGPKGRAKAHMHARLDDNRWEVVTLEVVLANGKKVILSAEDGGEDDAPPFPASGAPKADAGEPKDTGPAPEINLPTFDEPTETK